MPKADRISLLALLALCSALPLSSAEKTKNHDEATETAEQWSEVSAMREEVADLKAKMASVAQSQAPAFALGDAESLTSLHKKGAIRVGGDINVDLLYKRREDGNAFKNDEVDSVEFHTNSANLRFKIEASPDAYLYIKLDLDDFWNNDAAAVEQDDLLEEVRFVWNHIRGSNWGMIFGKGEVPYGQDRTLGIIQSYHHNDVSYSSEGPVFLLAGSEEGPESANGNPHRNVGLTRHPGEVDNVFMIAANWTYKQMLKWEIAVFQNNETTGRGAMTRGMHEDRSDDTLFFQSMATRLWITPMENLTLEVSFIKQHAESFGDDDLFGGRAEDDQYAISIGGEYAFARIPLQIFGEYQHGWDWAHTEGYNTDTYQLGAIWAVTDAIDLGLMAEWLAIDLNDFEQDYWRLVLSGKYRFDNGMYLILEYGHEWWDADYDTADDDKEADLLGFRAGWAF